MTRRAKILSVLLGGVALFYAAPLAGGPARTSASTPITFQQTTLSGLSITFDRPTALTLGPDGRLYVAEQEGRIRALTLGSNPAEVTAIQEITTAANLQEVFGIAFDPTDSSMPSPIYVSNTVSGYAGDSPVGSFPGMITKIEGVGYATRTNIITGLPNSNGGHQTNGLVFAEDGTLYIAQGSSTNAGVPASFFAYEEVPLSAAVLVANPSAGGFDGDVTYSPASTYGTNVDQVSGDVSVYAAGLRNPYDMLIHSNGLMYLTDNGPSPGIGAASTSCSTQAAPPSGPDELNIIEPGEYYGHPNRNRGRFDAAQCVYHSGTEGNGASWTGPIELLPTSSNGIVEYTANNFNGKLLSNLFYVTYVGNALGRLVLTPDGSDVVSHTTIASGLGNPLDVTMGPAGVLYVAEYGSDQIEVFNGGQPVGGLTTLSRLDSVSSGDPGLHASIAAIGVILFAVLAGAALRLRPKARTTTNL